MMRLPPALVCVSIVCLFAGMPADAIDFQAVVVRDDAPEYVKDYFRTQDEKRLKVYKKYAAIVAEVESDGYKRQLAEKLAQLPAGERAGAEAREAESSQLIQDELKTAATDVFGNGAFYADLKLHSIGNAGRTLFKVKQVVDDQTTLASGRLAKGPDDFDVQEVEMLVKAQPTKEGYLALDFVDFYIVAGKQEFQGKQYPVLEPIDLKSYLKP